MRDVAAAEQGWRMAQEMIADESYKMVILDELNIVLRYDYIPLEDVIKVLQEKRPDLHVVITGRNAKDDLVEIADLVTDMTQVKHPFRSGVKAQVGVEF
jgi:cob(I)alamin adenosyltransferase